MYCSNCGKEVKDNETYCSGCGCKVHASSFPKINIKSNPFFALMLISNVLAIFSSLLPIFYVIDSYYLEYVNVGLWRYMSGYENLLYIPNYQDFFRNIVERGVSIFAEDLLFTIFSIVFLVMGLVCHVFSIFYGFYFLYQVTQGVRGKRLADLSSRTMISGIAFFLCVLIYSFVPYTITNGGGEKPNITAIGIATLIILVVNVVYIEKEYVKNVDATVQQGKDVRTEKEWKLGMLIQTLVMTAAIACGITFVLFVHFKERAPYSPIYGWAIDGEWVSSDNNYNIRVKIDDNQVTGVVIDGFFCQKCEKRSVRDDGVGEEYLLWHQGEMFYLYIETDKIYVEEYVEDESYWKRDVLKRVR